MKENRMGTAPVFPLIMSMALPAMFSMLVQSLYNIVDSAFVARLGESALAAVSLAFPVQMLIISVGVGTGVGLNSLISRRLGEGDREAANRAAAHGFFLALLSWLIFFVFGLFFTRMFFSSFSNSAATIQMGVDYTSVVTIFSLASFVHINIEKTLQATGNMIWPMIFMLVGAITNIILDPIFIFGLLGVPAMGVKGAAIATVIGQFTAGALAVVVALTKEHEVELRLRGFRPQAGTIRDIYAVGLPSIVMQSIGSVLVMGLNAILTTFSEAAVAVLGAYFKLQSFVFMPVFGLNQGVMPIMGYNYGAGNKQRLMHTLRLGSAIALAIMGLGTVVFLLLPHKLLAIFDASAQMLEIGVPALRTICLCFLPAALGILFSTLFQAVGMGGKSLLVSLMRQLVLILPLAWLFSRVGLGYVWYAFPLAEGFTLAFSVFLVWRVYQTRIRQLVPMRRAEAQD